MCWLQVRAFYPESGKLKFVIPNAHHESVTALAICNDDETRPPWRLVTGGQDGRVRVWNVTSSHQVGGWAADARTIHAPACLSRHYCFSGLRFGSNAASWPTRGWSS